MEKLSGDIWFLQRHQVVRKNLSNVYHILFLSQTLLKEQNRWCSIQEFTPHPSFIH